MAPRIYALRVMLHSARWRTPLALLVLLIALAPSRATNWDDCVPFKFRTAENGSALVCLVPKGGSTQWKRLLWKHATGQEPELTDEGEDFVHNTNLPPEAQDFEVTSTTARFSLVRHPFTRLISAFRDKILDTRACRDSSKWSIWNQWPTLPKEWDCDSAPSLAQFVEWLVTQDPASVDVHFRPQSTFCNGFRNGQFWPRAIYKAEEMPLWYHRVVTRLHLADDARSGFQPHADGGTCFYACPGMSCEEMEGPQARQRCAQSVETGAGFTNKRASRSETHGYVQLLTDEVRAKLATFYAGDLELFKYNASSV